MHVVFQSRGGLVLGQKTIDPLTYRTGFSGCSYLLLRSARRRLKTRPNTDALSACRHSSLVYLSVDPSLLHCGELVRAVRRRWAGFHSGSDRAMRMYGQCGMVWMSACINTPKSREGRKRIHKMGRGTRGLLVSISIAMMQSLAHAQRISVPKEMPSAISITVDDGSGANQPASIQYGSLDQKAKPLCSLRVPDSSGASSPNTKGAQAAETVLTYRPICPRCKFDLFLKQTYSPYT